jgi:hypothetical protein
VPDRCQINRHWFMFQPRTLLNTSYWGLGMQNCTGVTPTTSPRVAYASVRSSVHTPSLGDTGQLHSFREWVIQGLVEHAREVGWQPAKLLNSTTIHNQHGVYHVAKHIAQHVGKNIAQHERVHCCCQISPAHSSWWSRWQCRQVLVGPQVHHHCC